LLLNDGPLPDRRTLSGADRSCCTKVEPAEI